MFADGAERDPPAADDQRHVRGQADRDDVAGLELHQLGERQFGTGEHGARFDADFAESVAEPLAPFAGRAGRASSLDLAASSGSTERRAATG